MLAALASILLLSSSPQTLADSNIGSCTAAPCLFISVSSNKALDVSNISKSNGAQVWQYSQNGQLNQEWTIQSVGNNAYAILSVNSGLALDIYDNIQSPGTTIQQWQYWGGGNQQWTFQQQQDSSYTIVSSNGLCLEVVNSSTADEAQVSLNGCNGSNNQHWYAEPTSTTPTNPSTPQRSVPPLPLHVAGNQVLNSQNQVVQLRGVNIASLVWTTQGEIAETVNPPPCNSSQTFLDTINAALTQWNSNFIRLALNPDYWWNTTGQGAEYRALVDQVVELVSNSGAYVNLDMHVSDAGQWGAQTTQHGLPDVNTQTVLADVAARYANNPAVLFGAYNEPQEVSWDQWLNGGWVTDITGTSFQGVGMQAMVDTVRQAGARNIVIVDGINWASNLQGVTQGYAVNDDNIMYDAHVYPGVGSVSDWDAKVGLVGNTYPLYVGEFGGYPAGNSLNSPWSDSPTYLASLFSWIQQHNYSFTAWTFGPDAPPTLLSDWCYTPSDYYGAPVKQFMTSYP